MTAALGARLARSGLSTRAPWVAAAVAIAVVILLGILERLREPAYAADRTLLGAVFGAVVPLLCYAAFEAVYRRDRPRALLDPLARHGADRRQLSLGVLLVLTGACAATTALLSLLAVFTARGAGDPGLLADAWASLWGGALTGAAYAGLLAIASALGRAGRLWLLFADWLFGSSSNPLALPWPRAHARTLFGGEPVLDFSQPASAGALLLIALVGLGISIARESR